MINKDWDNALPLGRKEYKMCFCYNCKDGISSPRWWFHMCFLYDLQCILYAWNISFTHTIMRNIEYAKDYVHDNGGFYVKYP